MSCDHGNNEECGCQLDEHCPKVQYKSILADLEPYQLPEEVKIMANYVYSKFHLLKSNRGKRLTILLFICTYNAYKELRKPKGHKYVAKIFKLTDKETVRAFNMYSEMQTGYRPPQYDITATHYIADLCCYLGVRNEFIKSAEKFSKSILEKRKELENENQEKLAAGILYYHATLEGLRIDLLQYSKMASFPETSIKNMVALVAEIDNSRSE